MLRMYRAGGDHAAVDQRLSEALQQLVALAETLKTAQGLRAGVSKVIAGIESCHEGLARSIGQARAAIRSSTEAAGAGAGEAA